MGFLRSLFAGQADPRVEFLADAPKRRHRFDVDVDPGLLYGVPPWQTAPVPRLSRREALSVPAVKRARDLIAGSVGGLPLRLYDATQNSNAWSFLDQPEETTTGVNTWTMVAEDGLFESVAWLRILSYDWRGRPQNVKRLDPRTVQIRRDAKVYVARDGSPQGMAMEYVPDDELIRIDFPNAPLLVVGARAIRTLIALAKMTDQAATGLPPMIYFTPADDADPFDEDDPDAEPDPDAYTSANMLTDWRTARQNGVEAYIPAAVKANVLGWNPEQLQLTSLRDQAVLEVARLTGVDAEELGVSTTSRTYFNAFDRKQDFIQFTLAGYMLPISQRLSMQDVTPRGWTVRHDLDTFFKADTLSRYQAYAAGLPTGAITGPEIRQAEGKPPLTPEEAAALPKAIQPPAPAPAETPLPTRSPANAPA